MKFIAEKLLLPIITFLFASYLRISYATTRWNREGAEEMYAEVSSGQPVIIVCWHQRLMNAPVSWDRSKGEACTLRSTSQAGRISGGIQRRLGFLSVAMDETKSNHSASRQIAKLMKRGVSLGITADGPEGPPKVLKTAVLEWARLTGAPIYLFAFSTKRFSSWNTWDKLMFPKPFTKGAIAHKRWPHSVPRKPTPQEMEHLRLTLENDLSALTDEMDRKAADL